MILVSWLGMWVGAGGMVVVGGEVREKGWGETRGLGRTLKWKEPFWHPPQRAAPGATAQASAADASPVPRSSWCCLGARSGETMTYLGPG